MKQLLFVFMFSIVIVCATCASLFPAHFNMGTMNHRTQQQQWEFGDQISTSPHSPHHLSLVVSLMVLLKTLILDGILAEQILMQMDFQMF